MPHPLTYHTPCLPSVEAGAQLPTTIGELVTDRSLVGIRDHLQSERSALGAAALQVEQRVSLTQLDYRNPATLTDLLCGNAGERIAAREYLAYEQAVLDSYRAAREELRVEIGILNGKIAVAAGIDQSPYTSNPANWQT